MKLLQSQKNELYRIIESSTELSPLLFELVEERTTNKTHIRYKSFSDYTFTIYSFSSKHLYVQRCPGGNKYTDIYEVDGFSSALSSFKGWLILLIREVQSEDLWGRIQQESENLPIQFSGHYNHKFTVSEYQELSSKLDELKGCITSLMIPSEQVVLINDKLDGLLTLATSLGRFDWSNLVIGTVISLIIQLEVNKENASALWKVIKQFFSGIHILH